MPKATLSFNIPEEQDEFKRAIFADEAHFALDEIRNEVFRPARKHGYSDMQVRTILNALDSLVETADKSDQLPTDWPRDLEGRPLDATDLVGRLEDLFTGILADRDLNDI